jgi:hypothetical protein
MSAEMMTRGGYPAEVLGVQIDPAIQAADVASGIAYSFGRYVPDGWKIRDGARGVYKAQGALNRAAPYVDVMASYDNPGMQLGADLEEVRAAVETDLLAQNTGMDAEQAARSVTPAQVAASVGSVLGDRLFAPLSDPDALRVPLLRDLGDAYARQASGRRDETVAGLPLRRFLPSSMVLKAAAPELLQALGFAPNHPMVLSADQGGFMRGAGKFFAGRKLEAIKRFPILAAHVRAALPTKGEQLRQGFNKVREFVGALTVPLPS